jgi:hypothetical protein
MSSGGNPSVQRLPGLDLSERHGIAVASLRHVDHAGAFAAATHGVLGCALPGTGEAKLTAARDILAWRSPTDTLLVCAGGSWDFTAAPVGGWPYGSADTSRTLEDIAAHTTGIIDGCLVDQTGGISVFVAEGPGTEALLSRLGGLGVPVPGQSSVGRIADLTLCIFSIRAGETWMLVERVYADHLRGWIQATLADLPRQGP